MTPAGQLVNSALFLVVMAALGVLFAAGVRLPVMRTGWRRHALRVAVGVVAAGLVILANMAFFRHDVHFDLTRSEAFTPSPDAQRVVRTLPTDANLLYFYQKGNPMSQVAKKMVEIMGHGNPRLHVRTIDPDQHPGMAARYEVASYNVAVLESNGRRIQVTTTDDREIALGLLRVTRAATKTICFATGHGEYDIDNMEYHTHFEGMHAHSHGGEGAAVVLTKPHGVGRLRRALERLGFATRKVTLVTVGRVPDECAAVVEANPRTRYAPSESDVLADFLARGGSALLLYDLGFPVEPRLAALLASVGVRVDAGVVLDPLDHYFTDEQMVAVSTYQPHPITRDLALTFFPGVRPLRIMAAPGVTVTPVLESSAESYVVPLGSGHSTKTTGARGPRVLAIAAEGTLPRASDTKPFRLVVAGDGDFASNSFFPYMSNSDLVLAMLAWLVREERAPTMRPPVEVLPAVVLTNRQVRGIFAVTVLVIPGLVAGIGGVTWWQRRC